MITQTATNDQAGPAQTATSTAIRTASEDKPVDSGCRRRGLVSLSERWTRGAHPPGAVINARRKALRVVGYDGGRLSCCLVPRRKADSFRAAVAGPSGGLGRESRRQGPATFCHDEHRRHGSCLGATAAGTVGACPRPGRSRVIGMLQDLVAVVRW